MNYLKTKELLLSVSDPVERLEILMDLGKQLEVPPANSECTEIFGCMSVVHICKSGNKFYGRADSSMVRGIVFLILSMIDDKTPDQIREMNPGQKFKDLNLHLGAGRMNGVNSILGFFEKL